MNQVYYVEADGSVFTLNKNGKHALPTSLLEIPFDVSITPIGFISNEVKAFYCIPKNFTFDSSWLRKRDLAVRDDVEQIVRRVIYDTKPKVYTGGIITKDKKTLEILMVLPKRGISCEVGEKKWELPGGFLQYGEKPEDAVVRETLEEIGLKTIVKQRPICIRTDICKKTGFYFHGIAYQCTALNDDINCKEDEIADAKYVKLSFVEANGDDFSNFALQFWRKSLHENL